MSWSETNRRGMTSLVWVDNVRRTWPGLAAGISKCLLRICKDVPTSSYDRIVCEVWFDSGRIIFLPTTKGANDKPRTIVQLASTFLQREFEKLLDDVRNPTFERDVSNLQHKIFQSFGSAT